MHRKCGTIDLLVRVRDIKWSAEEQVIIGCVLPDLKSQIVEEIVPWHGVRRQLVGEGVQIER